MLRAIRIEQRATYESGTDASCLDKWQRTVDKRLRTKAEQRTRENQDNEGGGEGECEVRAVGDPGVRSIMCPNRLGRVSVLFI